MIEYREAVPARSELIDLYGSVGWGAYTDDPDGLARAVAESTFVVTARDDERLVGLARVISDDHTIMYLQDVLVHPAHHRKGIGRALVERCIARFAHCRQKVLMTDGTPGQVAFYEALGYRDTTEIDDLKVFVRLG